MTAYRTAPPAAVPGSVPAVRRCHSRRGLALRVVPLGVRLDEKRLRRVYRTGGPDALAYAVRGDLLALVGRRVTTEDERRVLTAWFRYHADGIAEEYTHRAYSEQWPWTP